MKQRFSEEQFFRLGLALAMLAALIPLVLYAYLGTFSRYGSDDYCLSAFFLQDDLGSAMIERYSIPLQRYTNICSSVLWTTLWLAQPSCRVDDRLACMGAVPLLKEIGKCSGLMGRWLVLCLSLFADLFFDCPGSRSL
jgi:hypothetical protein